MVTGVTIDDQWYADEFEWWVASVPPYYCYNAGGVGADDLSTDATWLGTSMDTSTTPNAPTQYTNGVKFALVNPIGQDNPTGAIQYRNSVGAQQTLKTLSDNSTPYSNPEQYLQSSYRIGTQGNPLFFGPYNLNLTDSTVVDGDIIFITTGSDVIGGSNSGAAYGALDSRQFNLIFYSTGSANVVKLSEYVGNTNQTGRLSSQNLPNFTPTVRASWYTDTGVTVFVGIRSVASTTQVTWWPLTYDQNNVLNIISRNDS